MPKKRKRKRKWKGKKENRKVEHMGKGEYRKEVARESEGETRFGGVLRQQHCKVTLWFDTLAAPTLTINLTLCCNVLS